MENPRKSASNIFRTYRGMIVSLMVILLLGLLSVTWFRGDYLLTGTDFVFPPNRQEAFQQTFYLWDARSLGSANPRIVAWSVPQGLFLSLSDTMGLPLPDSQKIWFYFLFTFSGLSAFFLTVSIIKGNYKYLAGLTSGLFYMFNPFIAIGITTFPFLWLTYASLPLKLGLYIKGIKEKRKLKYIIVMCLVWWITSSSQYVNPKYLILDLLPLLLYLVFHILVTKDKHEIVSSLKFTGMLFVLLGIFNFYWIFPTVFHLRETIEMPISVYRAIGKGRLNDYILNSAPLIDALRLLGLWAFHSGFKGDPYFNWASVYNTPFFFLAGYLIPLVAFMPSLFKLKDKHTLFFCLFTLAALLGMSGASSPFGRINVYLVTHIPLAIQVFSIPYQIFGMYATLGYAFLFGYGITLLYEYIPRKSLMILIHKSNKIISAILIGFIVFLVIGVYAFPLWTGDVIQPEKLVLPSGRYRIPDHYYKAAIWMAAYKENFRIHPFPYSIVGYGIYRWSNGGFAGVDPTESILQKPLVWGLLGGSIGEFISRLCANNSTNKISQLFALENVKYILFHRDTNWNYIEGHPWWISKRPREFQLILNSQKGIHFEKSFGKLDFYKVSDNYFLPHIYPASGITFISSDINSLIPLTNTPYLDGFPALAFTEQQNEDSLLTLLGKGTKANGDRQEARASNQILFANSNFNDLVVDMAKAESEAKDERQEVGGLRSEVRGERKEKQSALSSQRPILVKLDKKGKGKIKIAGGGVYEVWIKNTENLARFKDWSLKINIDGVELKNRKWAEVENNKWIKVGEMELDKGRHEITVAGHSAVSRMIKDMEIIVVSKDKIKEYEDLLKSKDIGYLFYIDKEKIENMLKDKDRLKEIKLKKYNPFRIGKQEFYVPNDGNYSVKALVQPKRDFLMRDFVSSSSSSIKASLEAVSGWDIKSLNTTYKQNILEDGMYIDAYFQNKGDVKEYVVLTKKFPNISIKERPYLAFSCEMEDLRVQEVEIDVNLIDKSKWFSLFRTKKIKLKADNKQYVVNLYQKAKDIFGEDNADNLFIDKVVLEFKKKDGVDLSNRHIYSFIFKNITFLKTLPIIVNFEDKLSVYLPDKYYYFDTHGELKNTDFPEQIPQDIKDVYRLHLNRFIDLKETPILSLNFSKPVFGAEGWRLDAEGRDAFPSEWRVVLGLDFDGDEKEDGRVETLVPPAGLSDGKLLLTVKAYEYAKKEFPGRRNYNLLFIGISHPHDREIFYQTVMSKKLIRYRKYTYKKSDFKVGADILEIDNKIYKLPQEAKGEGLKLKGDRRDAKGEKQNVKNEKNNWVEFNNIQLGKGEHSLNVFENDRFKVEMVEVKQVKSEKLKVESYETPKVEFKKINPTRYVVNVKGAKGPFTLVFSESFHEGWKGYVRPLTVKTEPWSALLSAWKDRGNRIEIKDHFTVNGYANGWIVPAGKELEAGEDFEIVLEFKPQRLFEVGLLISGITLLGCVGYIGYDFKKRRKGKRPLTIEIKA